MLKETISRLCDKESLSAPEAQSAMSELMSGSCSSTLIASYLTALSVKGETIEEIIGSARGMREKAIHIHPSRPVLEIVGTGADHSNSFNISTTAALVAASGGVPVAKHGNRAASSRCGAADCLEALGINIQVPAEKCEEILENCGMCFLFAPTFHSAMKYVAPVRKELGIQTIFNILGPLTSPANASYQVMGVFKEDLVEPMAHVLSSLGVSKGMVVYGMDCLDEISMCAPTKVCEFENGSFSSYTITPEDFGYSFCDKEDLIGGDPQENAKITLDILSSKDTGPKMKAVCLNAGAGLYVSRKAASLKEGISMAEDLIASGQALHLLDQFRSCSYA